MSEATATADAPVIDPEKDRRLKALNATAAANMPSEQDPTGGVTDQQAQDATDWFLSEEVEEEGYIDFELNVSNQKGSPKWVRFRAGALGRARINEIRAQNTHPVFDKAKGEEVDKPDESAINGRIAAEGLLIPDLSKPGNRRVRGEDYLDPADALEARFAHKPGLVDQITGYVIDASGYNDEDSREVRAGKS